jgi:hypothetical protein
MDQIQINLIPREDRYGNKYYVASPNLKISVNLDQMVFFVFTADAGQETLIVRTRHVRDDKNEKDFSTKEFIGNNEK